MTARIGRISRETSESSINVEINLDGTGKTDISTGVPFYDHMLTALGKHGSFDLTVHAKGDTDVDAHHTVEDTAICLGQAFKQALGDKAGIRRFGHAIVPLDESLARVVVDVSGRAYCVHKGEPAIMRHTLISSDGGASYDTVMNRHVFESFAMNAGICLHIRVLDGRDPHHVTESEFKALARALREATEDDPRMSGIPSTKGAL